MVILAIHIWSIGWSKNKNRSSILGEPRQLQDR